jgi:hypothetical protein
MKRLDDFIEVTQMRRANSLYPAIADSGVNEGIPSR